MIRSSLCPGILTHRRLDHPRHGFSYSLYMLLLDLDELPEIDRRSRLFGHNRPRPIGFHDRDHLDEDARPVRLKVEDLLRRQGIDPPGGRILLLTHARVLGHVFNPVSFYYCYDAKGRLGARVAEVNNTFGDRHCYADASPAWRDKKVMHVSPFFSMSGSYRFDLPEPAPSRIVARVDLTREERPVLEARLTLRPRPLTDRALAGALVRYPFMTLKVVAAIHFEALRLWGKGARVFENPSYHPEAARKEVA